MAGSVGQNAGNAAERPATYTAHATGFLVSPCEKMLESFADGLERGLPQFCAIGTIVGFSEETRRGVWFDMLKAQGVEWGREKGFDIPTGPQVVESSIVRVEE